jgi:TPP-dependent pyruvate/acetoin dehydrogenase alpha subunit
MSNSIISSLQSFTLPSRLQPSDKAESGLGNATTAAKSPEEKFLDYAKKNPAEKMRDALLSSIGVTEEELKNMSPEQQQEIEQKIADKIKEAVNKKTENGGSAKGFFTDISA